MFFYSKSHFITGFFIVLFCVKVLFSFQVLVAVIPMRVERSCSPFTMSRDIIPSSWLNINTNNTQCIGAPLTDQRSVLVLVILTSTQRTTLWQPQDLIRRVAQHILFPLDIQLDNVGFSLGAIISLLLTLKYFTKWVIKNMLTDSNLPCQITVLLHVINFNESRSVLN